MAETRLNMLDVLASLAQYELAVLRLDDHDDAPVEDEVGNGVLDDRGAAAVLEEMRQLETACHGGDGGVAARVENQGGARRPWWTEAHAARSLELPIPDLDWKDERSHSWFKIRVSGTAPSLRTLSLPCPPQKKPNSILKLKLYPTRRQRYLLEQLFRVHRAAYNKLVSEFRTRFVNLPPVERPSFVDVMKDLRRYIAKKALPNDAVRLPPRFPARVLSSAYRDLQSNWRSAWASFKALRRNGKDPGIPTMHFKSKNNASASIGICVSRAEINNGVRFCPTYMELPWKQGIVVKPACPEYFDHMCRLQRLRSQDYFLCVPRRQLYLPTGVRSRACAIDPGVRSFATIYDPSGFVMSVSDPEHRHFRKCLSIDRTISYRAHHRLKRIRCRLARRLVRMRLRVLRMRKDMHHKLASWIAARYDEVLLPSFETSQMTKKESGLSHAISRRMLMQAHYSFRKLLEYKLERVGGKLIVCTEEFTTKTCTRCGNLHTSLKGEKIYRCQSPRCGLELDRDVNAARNIFLMNEHLLNQPRVPATDAHGDEGSQATGRRHRRHGGTWTRSVRSRTTA